MMNTCMHQKTDISQVYGQCWLNVIHPTFHYGSWPDARWQQCFLSKVLAKNHPKPIKIRIKPDFPENPVRYPVRSGRISALKIRYVRKSLQAYPGDSVNLVQSNIFFEGNLFKGPSQPHLPEFAFWCALAHSMIWTWIFYHLYHIFSVCEFTVHIECWFYKRLSESVLNVIKLERWTENTCSNSLKARHIHDWCIKYLEAQNFCSDLPIW